VGRAIVLELARRGCDVVVHYGTSRAEAESCAAEARGMGVSAEVVRADLGTGSGVEVLAEAVQARGRLDVLVHSASVYGPTPTATVTAEELVRQYRVNAVAPLVLTVRLAGLLGASGLAGGGAVVAMSDIHVLGRPRKDFTAYSMSKAALTQMVECLARDLAPKVRVNAVAPGVVAFPEAGYESGEAMQQAYLARVPLARSGTPEDAAKAVAYLALDAGYVTGAVLRVDGGRWLG
jgi:pteridine reductase